VDVLVQDSIDMLNLNLIGDGLDPVATSIDIDLLLSTNVGGVFIDFDTPNNASSIEAINNVISFIGTFNPLDTAGTDVATLAQQSQEVQIMQPMIMPSTDAKVVQYAKQNGTITGRIVNSDLSSISLECGTIDDISLKLSQLS
jgi:hypothetical protein